MMKKILLWILFILSAACYASESIELEKELIITIPSDNKDIKFSATEEGIYGLSAPAVLEDGKLMLLTNNKWDTKVLIEGNSFIVEMIEENGLFMSNSRSQNGYIIGTFNGLSLSDNKSFDIVSLVNNKTRFSNNLENFYFVQKGIVFHWKDNNFCAIDLLSNENPKYIDSLYLNDWLVEQKGSFSFDDNNHILYRDGIKWSTNYRKYTYMGKLKSGHNVFRSGDSIITKGIFITDSNDEVILKINFPDSYVGEYMYPISTSIGNYGELYLTSFPKIKIQYSGDRVFYSKSSEPFDISCVRNHLKYFGVLTDDRIRLRSEANTSSESLGTYSINTGFMILEKGTKQETIGGDTGVWYKVRLLDGKEGWFFGAYVRDLYDGPGTPLPWPNVADWN